MLPLRHSYHGDEEKAALWKGCIVYSYCHGRLSKKMGLLKTYTVADNNANQYVFKNVQKQ